jgi:hypothetical protein
MASNSNYTVEENHSQLLSSLGLGAENLGVFDGQWGGNGPVVPSYNPATNKIIGFVKTVSVFQSCNSKHKMLIPFLSGNCFRF